jgi:hypothetical protein
MIPRGQRHWSLRNYSRLSRPEGRSNNSRCLISISWFIHTLQKIREKNKTRNMRRLINKNWKGGRDFEGAMKEGRNETKSIQKGLPNTDTTYACIQQMLAMLCVSDVSIYEAVLCSELSTGAPGGDCTELWLSSATASLTLPLLWPKKNWVAVADPGWCVTLFSQT